MRPVRDLLRTLAELSIFISQFETGLPTASSSMANRLGYQPISQIVDEEADIGDGVQRSPATQRRLTRGLRRAPRPGTIDLKHLDNAFKRFVYNTIGLTLRWNNMELNFRWTESIAQKIKRKKKKEDRSRKEIFRSVFDPPVVSAFPPEPVRLEYVRGPGQIDDGFSGQDSRSQTGHDAGRFRRVIIF
jgi:hypothetical protein